MIQFELVTLDGIKFKQKVYEIQLPTQTGYVGIFQHHMPLVSMVETGIIKIRHKANEPDDAQQLIATSGGVVEIADDRVRVLVDEAERDDEVDEKAIKEAHEEALKLKREAKDQVSLEKAQALVDRTAVRLKVADLKRRSRRR